MREMDGKIHFDCIDTKVEDVAELRAEIERLKAELADCTRSHQKQNIVVEKLESECDRLEGENRDLKSFLARTAKEGEK